MSGYPLWPIAVIAVCGLCTLAERALPFLIFRGRAVPAAVHFLGDALPMAIIATLIVYCLRGALVSIAGGTLCCMLLTQLVF